METTFQRQTAKIASVEELLAGDYIVQEGWKPNYIQTESRRLTRVNIVGIIIEKPSPYEIILDDGTGTMLISDFNHSKSTSNSKVGQGVLIIGRPRKANDEVFIAAEAVQTKQIKENPLWLVKRKEELEEIKNTKELDDEYKSVSVEEFQEDEELEDTEEEIIPELTDDELIKFIKQNDAGEGCAIEEIIEHFGQEADNTILTLIAMGEVYEIRPGKIKVLE
ncbi:hypothetical protein JXA48_00145 [Candidatus Woesearchaeota archaeon]|nr:hypothetical protein [Candidatus Woesearchaeota archaeon]